MPRLTAEQGTQEWFDLRRGHITASTAAACLGLDPHTGPLAAWREIMGVGGRKQNRNMAWGKDNEARAVAEYEVRSGLIVQKTGFWVNQDFPWLGASPDGLVGNDGLLEVKCPAKVPDKLPQHHHIQCMVQLAVTGREWCDYFVLDHNDDSQAWRVTAKSADHWAPRTFADLLAQLEEFYNTYILTNTPPPRRRPSHAAAQVTSPAPKGETL